MSLRSRFGRLRGRRLSVSLASAGAAVVTAAGVTVAVVMSGSASAQQDAVKSFKRVPSDIVASQKPYGARQLGDQTIVVELAGDPVTVTEENSGPMSDSQRQSQRGKVRNAQAAAEQSIRALGGTVLGSYQMAYNGLKVRIPASKADKLLDVPGVVGIHPVHLMKVDNTHGVPLIGAPAAWDGTSGFHGEGVKVAVIDTGIDWTHADFGGPGTAAAYEAAHANETQPADPAFFGPNAPKVKGGVDLVGDSYNADPQSPGFQPIPHPDPNPLDCNGHGSHVAGTAVGFGVLADGSRYTGPYDATTISSHDWIVGPGVAPKADLYSIRVFGCAGSVDNSIVVDAIEWAVDHRMDVINMSLGSPFGHPDDPEAKAIENATKSGVIVVASSGNEGFAAPYMTGSPAAAPTAISVAAVDPTESFPATNLALSTGGSPVQTINANGIQAPDGTSLPIVVLRNANGGVSLGCDPAEYVAANVTGKLVVTARGTCARVARAVFGQQAGAAAVLMINNSPGFPPFEGPITGNPDTGEQFTVTIPFLGVPPGASANAIVAADGGSATLTGSVITNPGFRGNASFTSGGPRNGDSGLKPDVAAPGVSIASAGVGTGNGLAVLSGTSMASPHTAGLAALVRQANPDWRKVENWKAAIVNTADPTGVTGYTTVIDGAGLVQAQAATTTKVVAIGDKGGATLNYGFAELGKDFSKQKTITLRNLGNQAVTFAVSSTLSSGSPHSVSLSKTSVTVPARGNADVKVTLNVPAATAGTSANFADVAGLVQFTPSGGGNGGVALRVPYYLVPQTISHIDTKLDTKKLTKTGSATATVTNKNGAATGAADWYAWGLKDGRDPHLGSNDIEYVGVQSFVDDGVLVFAVAGKERWSTAADKEFDIGVDVNGDGADDYLVFAIDLGLIQTGTPNGLTVTGVLNGTTGAISLQYFADAPFDSSTIGIIVDIASLCDAPAPCLSPSNPRITYHASLFNVVDGSEDTVDGTAKFNVFNPSISTGGFNVVAPNGTATQAVTYNAAEFAITPALGFLIISHDNPATSEAETIAIH